MNKYYFKSPKKINLNRLTSGFTLIELAVTLILLGILSATVIPRFFTSSGFEEYAYRTEVISTLRALQLRAMQQIDADDLTLGDLNGIEACDIAHIVLVTEDKLGMPNDCDANPSFMAGWDPEEQGELGVLIENDNVSFDATAVGFFFSFDQMGRPVGCSPICDIVIQGEENLTIRIENEGYIHAL